ncbi:MAG TPA: iron-containing redox enzyme family protein, partial [Acidimicrobiales bacterium]|nr:iron-containing redox enzyme family protein [Acidimicrobiales bacterium]
RRAMTPDQLQTELTTALSDRRLLDHPFYRRWEAGTLQPGELGAYAAQYQHFEAALPGLLRTLLGELEPGSAADLVRRNLADEESNPDPHVAVFAGFAEAVGSRSTLPTRATSELLSTYRTLIESSPAAGLAAVVAYEMQAPEIAASKASGLRRHYGIDDLGTRFWDLHATMDEDHARWGIEALVALGVPESVVIGAARTAADAWWTFLDDRETASAIAA